MSWIEEFRRLLDRARRAPAPSGRMADPVTCAEAASQVYEWLDGELDPAASARVGAHLETCARCYPMLVFERTFLEALARVAEHDPEPTGLRERLLRALQSQGFPTS